MSGFLTHVADVRSYLNAIIFAERDRLATISQDDLPDAEQNARFAREWRETAGSREAAKPDT